MYLLQHPAIAQHTTGDLQLRVVDSLDHPLADVNVVVTGSNIQGARNGVSDGRGYVNILALPPGKISVSIDHVAYQRQIFEQVFIQLGRTTNLGEVRLRQRIHDLPELVISSQRLGVDPHSTAYGSNLHPSDFENLPVDRNYRSMTSLLPQVNASYYGDEVNMGGATGFENKYFVDGVEVTNPLVGVSGTSLPYNFVQEIEVKAGGYGAEFRSALGGLVNVVTYSGTNELHGSAFGFYTSNRFAGHQRVGLLDFKEAGFSNYDIGFGIGGPVIRDELWFYAAYNPTFALQDVNLPSFGISVDRTLVHSLATKLTWRASQQLRLILTATGDPTERKAVGRRVVVPPLALTNPDPYLDDVRTGGLNVSLSGILTLGHNILIDATAARIMKYMSSQPSTERGREEVFFNDRQTNVWSGGVQRRLDFFTSSTTLGLRGTILVDAHTVKAGIEYRVKRFDAHQDDATITRFNSTRYDEAVLKYIANVGNRMPSIFVQDTWRIIRGLRVHAGIRWDGQYIIGSNGEVAQKVTVPIQPRLGFTFLPGEDGTQKIFGSFGRFAQELNLILAGDNFSDQGYDYTIRYDHDPRVSRTGGVTTLNSLHTIRPEVQGLRGQMFDEFSLGYEQSITGNFRATVQGVYRTLREAIDNVWLTSESRYQFGNPGKGLLSEWPRPQRDYSALIFTIERHEADHFNFLASYVLSRNYGNYEGLFDAISHGLVPNRNLSFDDLGSARQNATGLVPNNRTYVFKFSGSYRFSIGIVAGISFTAQSGTPLSEYANAVRGITFLTPRGSAGRTPAIWDLNVRVTHELPFADFLRTKLILDVLHIASQRRPVDFDQDHYTSIDANGIPTNPNPTYGQAYRYQPPMAVRLGMEVNF